MYLLAWSFHKIKADAIDYHSQFKSCLRNKIYLSLHRDMLLLHQSGCDSGERLRTLMVGFAADWAGAAFVILPALRPWIGSIPIKTCP